MTARSFESTRQLVSAICDHLAQFSPRVVTCAQRAKIVVPGLATIYWVPIRGKGVAVNFHETGEISSARNFAEIGSQLALLIQTIGRFGILDWYVEGFHDEN